ncbi:hypothetical protein [Methanofollis fontis]|uniref:Uncharacterized protein n=1 Tax=Methanofollis fontis TaxID=2052832 RepID=A0A483CQ57_9EURY|nr:hypothetical protein [Methanofollis fontis]TAJ43183.1 hypothetical protein CUJ86_11725 [Methanofollis fontis]
MQQQIDYNAGCRTREQLSRAGRVPLCPVCGVRLDYGSTDRVEGADYYHCPEHGLVKWMWW